MYDSIRAAGYLLQTLGIAYVWPSKYLDKLRSLLDKTIVILSNMIHPPNENWTYLEMDDDSEKLIQSVSEQIIALQERKDSLV